MISSKIPKSFRDARDLMVFYNFFLWFSGIFQTFKNSPNTTKSRAPLKLFGILLEITWLCSDLILRKIESSFFYGPSPSYRSQNVEPYSLSKFRPRKKAEQITGATPYHQLVKEKEDLDNHVELVEMIDTNQPQNFQPGSSQQEFYDENVSYTIQERVSKKFSKISTNSFMNFVWKSENRNSLSSQKLSNLRAIKSSLWMIMKHMKKFMQSHKVKYHSQSHSSDLMLAPNTVIGRKKTPTYWYRN